MKKPDMSRRSFVQQSLAVAGPTLVAANALALPATDTEADRVKPGALKIVCIGGHPDDPESGCAGTLARYAEAGHNVTVIYLTRGERGISGKSNEEAAAI